MDGWSCVRSIRAWWDADAQVDFKRTIVEKDSSLLRQAPPEALGRLIQLIMKSHDDDDYDRILAILEQTREGLKAGQRNHELRWILRFVNRAATSETRSDKDASLREGTEKIRDFFEAIESGAKSHQHRRLGTILAEAR